MVIEYFFLFFLACGAVTFPLTLMAVRYVASLSPAGRIARRIDDTFEKALTISIMVWIVGALTFYGIALYYERQKYCDDQRTNQVAPECRKLYGQED